MSGASTEHHQRIVVGVDGSPASDAALRWAADEAVRRGGRLEAVIAWRPMTAPGPPAGQPRASARSLAEREEDAEAVLDGALARLAGDGAPGAVGRRVMRGSAHRVLVEAADGASLLVIGGHSGKFSGKLPWSTGQHVVRDAHCPVVVVPPNGGARGGAVPAGEAGRQATGS